jgi:hypothetical protein
VSGAPILLNTLPVNPRSLRNFAEGRLLVMFKKTTLCRAKCPICGYSVTTRSRIENACCQRDHMECAHPDAVKRVTYRTKDLPEGMFESERSVAASRRRLIDEAYERCPGRFAHPITKDQAVPKTSLDEVLISGTFGPFLRLG